jgi:penicillin-binding protein 2
MDPNNGEILAMASYPSFNPNDFVPVVRQEVFTRYSKDPADLLVPRAFRSAYPPGSTFKTFVGFAGLQTGRISAKETFPCPSIFHRRRPHISKLEKGRCGTADFQGGAHPILQHLVLSGRTQMGPDPIIDYAKRLGSSGAARGNPLPLRGFRQHP